MKFSRLIYTCVAGVSMMPFSSCGAWMLSGGDLFYDDPLAPPPPQLYNPPLPPGGLGWGYNPNYYPGWNNGTPPPPPPGNNHRPPQQSNPPAQNRPPQQQQPSQPVLPSQPTNNGQRPGANINFGSGSTGNSQSNRPAGGANGRH